MIKTKKNKSILKRILAFLGAGICAIACCFTIFNISKKSDVDADSVSVTYDFVGSNFNLGVFVSNQGTAFQKFFGIHLAEFQFMFSIGSNADITLGMHCFLPEFSNSSDVSAGHFQSTKNSSQSFIMDNSYYRTNIMWADYENGNTMYTTAYFCISKTFNGNVKTITFGSDLSGALQGCPLDFYNYVAYFDVNGSGMWLTFERCVASELNGGYIDQDTLALDYRIYYLNNPSNYTDNEMYNYGYSGGYNSGYDTGYSDGKNNGYSDGYNVGQNVGYNIGYNNGVSESNDYTFLGLVSACIDAPITYFNSLFNFELLGVNLSSFLTALFTICVIVTIVKLCLGR